MKYLRPISIIASVVLFFLFMNYEVILHKSFWKLKIPLGMVLLLMGLFILFTLLLEFWNLYSNKTIKPIATYIFIGYLVFFSLLMIVNPFNFPSSPSVKHKGFWQGSGSSGSITLYNDKIFEIEWNGLLRGGKYVGEWKQNFDTFYLNYEGRSLDRVGDKLVYRNNYLSPLDGVSGLFLRHVNFKCTK